MDFTRRQFMKLLPSGIVAVASTLSSLDNLVAEDGQDDVKAETVLDNGPSEKRHDLIFIPQQYDAQKEFDKDVDKIVQGMDKYAVFKEYKKLFNARKIWDASNEKKNLTELREIIVKVKGDVPCVIVKKDAAGHANKLVLRVNPDPGAFSHELGHVLGLADEYGKTEGVKGINTSSSDKDVPWKELIDKKIKGIGIYKVEDSYFRAEEKPCIMVETTEGTDFGPLCANLVILYLRKKCGVVDEAPSEVKPITKGQPTGIELKLLSSASFSPTVNVVYASGTADEMDVLYDELKGKKLTFDSFGDKKYKKATVSAKKNVATITDKLPVGSHLIAVVAKDPNPAILMDPDKVTYDQRIYRLDVTEKK